MYQCTFCNKQFKKLQGKVLHEKSCSLNPLVTIEHCSYCDKLCSNHNSRINHERLCSNNPNKQKSNLTDYLDKVHNGEIKHWAKGKTAATDPVVAKYTEKIKLTKSTRSYSGWHQTEEAKQKIGKASSKNLSEGYASGRIKSSIGVGRGKSSYFIVNGNKYLLRSTWEFIYALYLANSGKIFEVEAIRVPALRANKYAKTFISDFSYDNTVVEIKGIRSEKDELLKEAFEAAGYTFIELYEADINKIKEELVRQGYEIDGLLNSIRLGHETKNYFTYEFQKIS